MKDIEELELLILFKKCNKALHKCHQQNDPKGSFRGKGQLLSVLSKQDGISQTELANHMDIARASMSELLMKVEKAGLVKRKPDSNDKRIIRVYLTQLGKDKAIENSAFTGRLAVKAFEVYTQEEMNQLALLLSKFIEQLNSFVEEESKKEEGE